MQSKFYLELVKDYPHASIEELLLLAINNFDLEAKPNLVQRIIITNAIAKQLEALKVPIRGEQKECKE